MQHFHSTTLHSACYGNQVSFTATQHHSILFNIIPQGHQTCKTCCIKQCWTLLNGMFYLFIAESNTSFKATGNPTSNGSFFCLTAVNSLPPGRLVSYAGWPCLGYFLSIAPRFLSASSLVLLSSEKPVGIVAFLSKSVYLPDFWNRWFMNIPAFSPEIGSNKGFMTPISIKITERERRRKGRGRRRKKTRQYP